MFHAVFVSDSILLKLSIDNFVVDFLLIGNLLLVKVSSKYKNNMFLFLQLLIFYWKISINIREDNF